MPGDGQIVVPRDKLSSSVGEKLAGKARQEVVMLRLRRPPAESAVNGVPAVSMICILAPSFGSLVCRFPLADVRGVRLIKTKRKQAY
jgi:hypothetical protein